MTTAIKIKAGSEIISNGVEGVQQFTDAEIKNRTAQVLTTNFAGTIGTGSLQVTTTGAPVNFTSVGTFTDTVADSPVGTHPWAGGSTTVNTYTFSQGTSTAADNISVRPVRYNSTSDSLEECSDSEISTEVIDLCIKAMVDQDANTAGQYILSASTPSGGTWTSRGTISDTQVDGTTATKTLWQKTAPTTVLSSTSNRTIVKTTNGNLKEFTDTEIENLSGRFRNRIIANNIGKYVVDTAAPGTGTWQQMGETLTDQRKTSASYNYAGSYTGSYSGTYTGFYTGTYSGTYTGSYARFFGGFLNGNFSGNYTGSYSGAYTGNYTGSYSGTYIGYYAGETVISTSATQESKKLFVRIA